MPENIRCTACGKTVLGLVITGLPPEPLDRDSCPSCGGAEFERLIGGDAAETHD